MVITGIIRPPPDIRAVADRTALYVAKNGRDFEMRIKNSAKGQTPKFAFLQTASPFYAYYETKIQTYEANGCVEEKEDEDVKKVEEELQKKKEDDEKKKQQELIKMKKSVTETIDPIAKMLLEHRKRIQQITTASSKKSTEKEQTGTDDKTTNPETTKVTKVTKATSALPLPPALSMVDIIAPINISILGLETIQLVAQFTALSNHMHGMYHNFLQQFIRREWYNPTYIFCQPRHGHFPYFTALVDAYTTILKDSSSNAPSSTQSRLQQLAGNIPECLQAVTYRVEYNHHQIRLEQTNTVDATAVVDWNDFVVVETIDFPADEVVELSMLPPPPSDVAEVPEPQNAADAMHESDDDDEQIRVVSKYESKVVGMTDADDTTVIDPISGATMKIADMPEHMRIQLLDPQWAKERKIFQDKQKGTNLVSGDGLASNLERFAAARGDRFGTTTAGTVEDAKKRLEEANRIIQTSSAAAPAPAAATGQYNYAQASTTTISVAPGVPVASSQQHGLVRKQMESIDPIAAASANEPDSKRPKITYAPSVNIAPPPPPVPTMEAVPPPPPTMNPAEAMAAAMTGALPIDDSDPIIATPAATELRSESEFVASLGDTKAVTIQIKIPNDATQMAYNFYGQTVSVDMDAMEPIKALKLALSKQYLNNLPNNKFQLRNVATRQFYNKDAKSLASMNIGGSVTANNTLEVVPRVRGGKKK